MKIDKEINVTDVDIYIKNLSSDDINFTPHSKEKLNIRGFTEKEIINNLLSKNPIGIIKQEKLIFKFIFNLDNKYDLNIIFLVSCNKIVIITIFKCLIKKRSM